jgi:O-antigen/teichoic acid export membrane protein
LPNGQEQSGIYALAFRLLDAVSMFGVLFAGLLLPIFARMLKKKEELGSMVQFSFLLLFVPAIIISFSSIFYDHQIMSLLYSKNIELTKESIELSASILRLLMVSFLGIATTYIFGTLLTANGSIRQLNFMAVVGMFLNIGLNLILIPHLQALGSAWASLATQVFTALAQTLLAVSILKLKINYRLIGKLILFIGFVLIIGYSSRMLGSWVLGYSLMIGVSALFAFSVRLINLRALAEIIQNK